MFFNKNQHQNAPSLSPTSTSINEATRPTINKGNNNNYSTSSSSSSSSSIKQASIIFYPNLKTTTTQNTNTLSSSSSSGGGGIGGVYSQNVNRQRTFTTYYNSLEAQEKQIVQLKQQSQLRRNLPNYQNNQTPIPIQQNFLASLKYTSSKKSDNHTYHQFNSNSMSDYDENKSLMNIKENYNRSIAGLGESLDLFNITSSAAARILGGGGGSCSTNHSSILNMDYYSHSHKINTGTHSSGKYQKQITKANQNIKQLLILKVKNNIDQKSDENVRIVSSSMTSNNSHLNEQQKQRTNLSSSKSYGRQFVAN